MTDDRLRRMCNLYTYKMSADEMRGLMSHNKLIGTTWTERMPSRGRQPNSIRRGRSRVSRRP